MKLMKMEKVSRTMLLLQVLVLAFGELHADPGEAQPELECQAALVEALAVHLESLAPVDGAEVRFEELRAALKQLEVDTLKQKLSREHLALLELLESCP